MGGNVKTSVHVACWTKKFIETSTFGPQELSISHDNDMDDVIFLFDK